MTMDLEAVIFIMCVAAVLAAWCVGVAYGWFE